jgi:signal transduction histidine kinase
MQPELCDLNEIAVDAHRLAKQLAAAKQVSLECATDSRLPRTNADPSLLEQAFYLILSNAIEATESGGTVSLRLMSEHSPRTEFAIIQVEDTGAGIPADLIGRVFDPFVTTKKGGSGLGLAQAKKIIDLHLGTIDIASAVGRGTKLTIRLPIHVDT